MIYRNNFLVCNFMFSWLEEYTSCSQLKGDERKKRVEYLGRTGAAHGIYHEQSRHLSLREDQKRGL